MFVTVAVLFTLRTAGVLSNWWFGILAVFAVFASPGVAEGLAVLRARGAAKAAGPELPLELVGVDRPFTAEDSTTSIASSPCRASQ